MAISDSEAESTDSVAAVVSGRPVARRAPLALPQTTRVVDYGAVRGPILTRMEEGVLMGGDYHCHEVSSTLLVRLCRLWKVLVLDHADNEGNKGVESVERLHAVVNWSGEGACTSTGSAASGCGALRGDEEAAGTVCLRK